MLSIKQFKTMAKTVLTAISKEGKNFRISVDLTKAEIEENEDGTCNIVSDDWMYTVTEKFNTLHYYANGFSMNFKEKMFSN